MSLGKRLGEPDDRLLRWGWLAFAAWTAIGVAQLGHLVRAGDEALVGLALAAPLWAAWLLWLLWRLSAGLRRAGRWRAFGRWHGRYYEFDGLQVRVVFDGERLLVAAPDVYDALGIAADAREPQRVRLLAGRDGLIGLPGEAPLFFTERGLRAWLQRRSAPAAARFGRWFEQQVAAPRRRQLERGAAGEG